MAKNKNNNTVETITETITKTIIVDQQDEVETIVIEETPTDVIVTDSVDEPTNDDYVTTSTEDNDTSQTSPTLTDDRKTEILFVLGTAKEDIATITERGVNDEDVKKAVMSLRTAALHILTTKGDTTKTGKPAKVYTCTYEGIEAVLGKGTVIDVMTRGVKTDTFTIEDGVHEFRTWADSYFTTSSIVREVKKAGTKLTGDYTSRWVGVLTVGDVMTNVMIVPEVPTGKYTRKAKASTDSSVENLTESVEPSAETTDSPGTSGEEIVDSSDSADVLTDETSEDSVKQDTIDQGSTLVEA